jgi:CheY-like chemotaxis protein
MRKIRHESEAYGFAIGSFVLSGWLFSMVIDLNAGQVLCIASIGHFSEDACMQAPAAQADDSSAESIPRLLVADDSPFQRHGLCEFLRQNGYEVAEAGDGHAVLRHLKECELDLLLLDLNMPQGDGFEVLKYLQEHRQTLPVIVLSGMPLDQIQQQMHRLRKQELPALLLKPVDPQQLLEMVELQLSGQIG